MDTCHGFRHRGDARGTEWRAGQTGKFCLEKLLREKVLRVTEGMGYPDFALHAVVQRDSNPRGPYPGKLRVERGIAHRLHAIHDTLHARVVPACRGEFLGPRRAP